MLFKISVILLAVALSFFGCLDQTTGDTSAVKNSSRENAAANQKNTSETPAEKIAEQKKISIADSKGVVIYTEDDVTKESDKLVRIFDKDGGLWHKFTFYYDDSNGKFEYENENFKPLSFHPDNFVLALKCVGETDEYYKIIADEEKGTVKFVKKDDSLLKLETWEKHILSLNAVSFDLENNPLRDSPDGKPVAAKIKADSTFTPKKIKSIWLNVENSEGQSGWIKWKDKDSLLIDMFYTS